MIAAMARRASLKAGRRSGRPDLCRLQGMDAGPNACAPSSLLTAWAEALKQVPQKLATATKTVLANGAVGFIDWLDDL